MENNPASSENIVTDLFDNYGETQKELLAIKLRKTRNCLFYLAILFFAADFISLSIAHALSPVTFLYVIAFPVILIGLAFLAMKEPLIAMILAALFITGLWAYIIYINGARAVISGWLIKAIVVYLVIAGFRHASEANTIKKELRN